MIYYFYNLFDINILGYISVRAGISFFIALFLTMFLLPKFIKWAKKTSSTQPINSFAPETHQLKSKTPTMGGIVFILSSIIASLLTIKLTNLYALGAILVLILFSAIGFIDDFAKVKKNQNLAGLKARTKFILQILASFIVTIYLCFIVDFDTNFYVPFLKTPLFDMNNFAIIFWMLVIIASSNAVNLTDGLDGLATVPSMAALTTFSIFIYIIGNVKFSSYLLYPHFNIGEVTIVATALIGALAGFLWFNCYPAEVFMGDSGSLTIGAVIGYMAIITKNEILLLLIGFIFVLETVSVILQVGSFRFRKKRIFLMAPIHHHFEMKKWAESKIIVRFWMIAILTNILALITLKIR